METLSAYIPIDRHRALVCGETLPDRTHGAVLFADISGFTPLTAALAAELGPLRGAEELTRQLNHVFGALIAEVQRYGGGVIGFSGDGITCWFDETSFETSALSSELGQPTAQNSEVDTRNAALAYTQNSELGTQNSAALRAVACALAMQGAMRQFASIVTPAGSAVSLGVKVAVAAGPARRFLVGHPRIQRLDVLAGALLDRVAVAEQLAHSGEVVVSDEVAAQAGELLRIATWRGAGADHRYGVVGELRGVVPPAPWPSLPELPAEVARDWLLPPVYQRLQRGEGGFLAEFRPAVALFLKFGGIAYDHADAGPQLDDYVRWVQTVLARYEGYLLQLTIGDKGSYMYIAFGAPLAHEDDSARAVAAARDLRSPPPELAFVSDLRIGISRGLMHAGAYGAPTRRTYGVLGSAANVAARLMNLAAPGQILATEGVAETASGYAFDSLGPVALKGYAQPIGIALLRGKRPEQDAHLLKGRPAGSFVGRAAERAILADQLRGLLDGRGGCVLIEGEAGIGKSRLVAELLDQARELGIPTLLGAGESIEQATAYFAWRPIFRAIFGLPDQIDSAAAREQVLAQLPGEPHWLKRAPLLNSVLPVSLPESDLTEQMTGEVRIKNTQDVLLEALARAPRATSALALVLEDAHWLDSASWALLARAQRELPGSLFVVVTRPIDLSQAGAGTAPGLAAPEEYRRLRDAPDTRRIQLTSLAPDEALELVRQRLGARDLPAPLARLILRRAEGHPFFSEELAYALRDAGLIQIRDGQCTMAGDASDLSALDFPQTIQGVITSRIDRLPPAQQLTLKVASVIGRIFAFRLLENIHPIAADRPQLQDYLDTLERLDITPIEAPEPDLAYIFKHIITQEVAYQLLLFSQRRELHHAVAAWYERAHQDDLEPYFPLLAHHWSRAEVADKAIEYLEKAGEQASRQYALQETIYFFDEALRLEARKRAGPPGYPRAPRDVTAGQLRRARWLRYKGLAMVNLGQLTESQPHLEEALRLLGAPLPATKSQLRRRMLVELGRQIGHLARRPPIGDQASQAGAVLYETSRVISILGNIYAVTNEIDKAGYTLLVAFNRQELLSPSNDLAVSATGMAYVAKLLGAEAMARRYNDMAVRVAAQVNQLTTNALVFSRVAIFYGLAADWRRAEQTAAESIAIAERLQDRYQWQESSAVLNTFYFNQARYQECARLGAEIERVSRREGNALIRGWALGDQARSLLRLGDFAGALRYAEQIQAVHAEARLVDPGTLMLAHGVRACAYAYGGDFERAGQSAAEGLALLREHARVLVSGASATQVIAEAHLALLELDRRGGNRRGAADEASRLLLKRAQRDLLSRPGAWLYRGRYLALIGRPRQARRHLRAALKHAERCGMPFEQAQAHFDLARFGGLADAQRADHHAQAIAILAEAGAVYDLERARALSEPAALV